MATITEQLTTSQCERVQETFTVDNWSLIRNLLLQTDEKWKPLQNCLIEAGVKSLERLEVDKSLEEFQKQERS